MRSLPDAQVIIFYDGECALCHGFVQFVLKREVVSNKPLAFAPLQGTTAAQLMGAEKLQQLPDSVIYVAGCKITTKSAAVMLALKHLCWPWPCLGKCLQWVPEILRDWCYDVIAGLRRRILAKPQSYCPITPPSLRERLLP